jgi:hypothetical protein
MRDAVTPQLVTVAEERAHGIGIALGEPGWW